MDRGVRIACFSGPVLRGRWLGTRGDENELLGSLKGNQGLELSHLRT